MLISVKCNSQALTLKECIELFKKGVSVVGVDGQIYLEMEDATWDK